MNRKIHHAPFYKMVIRLGFVFVLVVGIIQFFYNLFSTGSLAFFTRAFREGTWLQSLIYYLIIGIVYGVTMGLIIKNNNRR